jgi:pyruvate, orthophosphate dikinase
LEDWHKSMTAYVFKFGGGAVSSDPRSRDKTIVGGKGANLAEMAAIGLPVPPGFTITTEECVRYLAEGGDFSAERQAEVASALTHIEKRLASASAMPPIPCWSRSVRVRGYRCRA